MKPEQYLINGHRLCRYAYYMGHFDQMPATWKQALLCYPGFDAAAL